MSQNNRGNMPPANRPGADNQDPKDLENKDQSQDSKEPKKLSPAEKFLALKNSLPKGKPIQVIALIPGFYQNQRRKEGDKFMIAHRDHLGTWMKPI